MCFPSTCKTLGSISSIVTNTKHKEEYKKALKQKCALIHVNFSERKEALRIRPLLDLKDSREWWHKKMLSNGSCSISSSLICFCYVFVCFSRQRVSLCTPGTLSVNHLAVLKLREPPAFAYWVPGLKACATTPSYYIAFFNEKQFSY